MREEIQEVAEQTVSFNKLFDFTLEIPEQETESSLRGEWLKIETADGRILEGAFYESGGPKDVVIFIPGMPGDTVERFENEAVPELLRAKKSVFVARHNGLRAGNVGAEKILHNSERKGSGDLPGDAGDLFSEPQTAIEYFAAQGFKITLLTHSIGSVAAAKSIIELKKNNPRSLDGMKWVNAAGSLWDTTDASLGTGVNPDKEAYVGASQYFAQYYKMPSDSPEAFAEKVTETLIEVREKLPSSILESMRVVNIYAQEDQLVVPEAGQSFHSTLGDKALLLNYIAGPEASNHEFSGATPKGLVKILLKRNGPNPKGRSIDIG